MPGPTILEVTRQFERAVRRMEAGAVRQLSASYAAVARDLGQRAAAVARQVQALRDAGEAVPPWRVTQLQGYIDMQRQVAEELGRLSGQSATRIARLQQMALDLGDQMAAAQLGALAASIEVTFFRPPLDALKALTGFLADGSPLAALLRELGEETARTISDLLIRGLGLGWNPRKIADAIKRAVGIDLTRALRIARTEILRSWRESSIASYRANAGIIKGYVRHAQQDDRTCIACLLMDGTFYELAEDFSDHVQGRCALIPVTKTWEELGITGVPDTNATWTPAEDWFLEQDADTQRGILGNGMYDAWKAGDITLDDTKYLHRDATWGDSWQQRSLQSALDAAERRKGGVMP